MTSGARSPAVRWFALVSVVLALALATWLVLGRRNERAAVGRELVFDDFGFRIEPPATERTVSALEPTGELRVVRLRVSNHAKVVDYELGSHVPLLIDADGREYRAMVTAVETPPGGEVAAHSIAAGESCVQELYFDVPKAVRDLHLKVSWGSLGDGLDSLLVGDKSFAIE